jgi:hypothetical protein
MNTVFGELIRWTIEAYADDIVVKSKHANSIIDDLGLAFVHLKLRMLSSTLKSVFFGVPGGMLLGFIVSRRGTEANLEKISAITNMGPIHNLKGVQRVTRCLAALRWFISCLDERGLPLYKLLKKANHFAWTPEAHEALDKLKKLLTSPPILVAP